MATNSPPPPAPPATNKKLSHPLPAFAFQVQIGGHQNSVAYFKSVSGLKYETETVPVVAGGSNSTTFNLVGATKWSNIVLKRGFTKGSSLLFMRDNWMYKFPKTRFDGAIVQLNTQLQPVVTWRFTRGWPVKWEISDFDATKSEVSIETLEIAHDGLTIAR
ncbi:MAG TPA: phage tail protein [Pirellulales bacterium]|jgi:phage tail-like protein|nr:phage tail protein [Pirellulales bacterium]